MSASPPLSASEYIAWVQRSLNRILGQSEVTDGVDTPVYRDLIELFQRTEDLAVTRSVYPVDQNRIIQRNHADAGYLAWVRNALRGLGFPEPSDKQAITAFQKSVGLGSDGWLGAQTEVAIIAKVKTHPPGHRTKPRDKPKPPPRGLSMLERFLMTDTQETGYARALPSIRRIHLGMAWITPGPLTLGGPDPERVQTFVHEAAHIAGRFSSDEGDHYGPDSAKGLADETMRATRNADNYGYYAIHVALHAR